MSALLPEFFAFLGVDLFVAMSLLTCLLDDHFPKILPYIFQMAGIGGYIHILISKELLPIFGDYMRFWYCFIYLAVALGTIIALNVYLAVIKKKWALAKVFSGAALFPSMLVSAFFISSYVNQIGGPYLTQVAMLASVIVIGLTVSVLVSPKIFGKSGKRR